MAQFNLKQISNQTPKTVKQIRDGLLFIIAGSLVATSWLAPILNMAAADFAAAAGFAIVVIRGVSMMFGVTDEQALNEAKKVIDRIENKDSEQ